MYKGEATMYNWVEFTMFKLVNMFSIITTVNSFAKKKWCMEDFLAKISPEINFKQ